VAPWSLSISEEAVCAEDLIPKSSKLWLS
jgi:hypothetical protein